MTRVHVAGCLPLDVETETDLMARHNAGEVLKAACAALGLKIGGTPEQRAQRLLFTKGKPRAEWPRHVFASTDARGGGGGVGGTKRKRSAVDGE